MSLLNNSNAISTGGDYNLENSLRFRSSASAYLSRTPTTAGNRKTWTWSAWVKRGTLATQQVLFSCFQDTSNYTMLVQYQDTFIFQSATGGSIVGYKQSSAVFRDPAAWYHVVYEVDTTQATAADRIKMYVNNVQITSFTTNTIPAQNYDTFTNTVNTHNIGRYAAGSLYFDGYLTEVNLIDGQALTPSDFGEYNEDTGVWQPKKYTGTYGTNGFYLPFTPTSEATYSGDFTGSNYLYLSNPTELTLGTGDFTIETWVKFDNVTTIQGVYDSRPSTINGNYPFINLLANGTLVWTVNTASKIISSPLIADNWYHVAVARSGTSTKMFINGIQAGSTYSDSTNYLLGSNRPVIGTFGGNTANGRLTGNLSNFRVVKGTAVYTANFTVPTAPLTAITNTSLLTLQDSTIVDNSGNSLTINNVGSVTTSVDTPFNAGTITSDKSGNSNNWFANNINYSTPDTTYDIMTDVPTLTDEDTANYCTLNPLRYGIYPGAAAVTLSEANLKATWSGDPGTLISTINIPTTGKWYWEAVVPTQTYNFFAVGVVKNQETTNLNNFAGTTGYAVYAHNGLKYILGTGSAYMATPAQNTVITVAFDADTGSLYVGAGGSWANGSGSTNQTFSNAAEVVTGLTGDISPAFSFNSGSFIVNFGQRPFTYTPPTGYLKLNTFNLPDSSIVDGSENFGVGLWTGTGSVTAPNIPSVTNLKFKPEFLWSKSRSTVANNYLYDIVRSPGDSPNKFLGSNTTDVEQTFNAFTLTDTGFNLATTNVYFNQASATYVAWNWKAGGTAVSNTDGTITSSVSANPTAGFSVLTYTGTGGTKTVGHGLGVAPQMVIVKGRNGGTNWVVYHVGMGATKYMLMNTTSAAATDSTPWNNTSPTSTVVSLGTSSNTNGNTAPFVAYCFAEVEGYSKFGSYTGNGSTDGPFVYTGFRPAFVMIKNSSVGSGGYDWVMIDTSRSTYNIQSASLSANLSSAEYTGTLVGIDILSNGFKSRVTNAAINGNGNKMIYMAFAENPFKNSLAR